MHIEKNHAGAWVVWGSVGGSLVTRTYYYYTKRESVQLWRKEFGRSA